MARDYLHTEVQLPEFLVLVVFTWIEVCGVLIRYGNVPVEVHFTISNDKRALLLAHGAIIFHDQIELLFLGDDIATANQ